LASTLPIADESSAVWIDTNPASRDSYAIRFDPPPLIPARVVFERGFELAAYSTARQGDLIWLRLKWILRRARRRRVRFFGHLIEERSPETPALAQFDQDLPLEDRGPATAVEQHVVRAISGHGPTWLRVGLFHPSNLKRLRILEAAPQFDPAGRCAYLE